MSRVRASMADVSTEFVNITPGVYELEIVNCEEKKVSDSPERYAYAFEYRIVGTEPENADMQGKTFKNSVHISKKDGQTNEYGVAELKRHFEVTLGEEAANDPDADTDSLKNQRFRAQTILESFKKENKLTGQTDERKSTKIEAMAPLA